MKMLLETSNTLSGSVTQNPGKGTGNGKSHNSLMQISRLFMRRALFCMGILLSFSFVSAAQGIESDFNPSFANKRGVYLLPQAGNIALGIDATPMLSFMGNLFTSGVNTPPAFNGVDYTIFGKYFLRDNRALRARLSIEIMNQTFSGVVPDDVERARANGDINATALDIMKRSSSGFEFGIGYELRRGDGRVQGFFGGEAFIGFVGGGKATYEYANEFATGNTSPSSFDFGGNLLPGDRRILEDKWNGNILGFGVGGFIGVEYFFAPKISIGGEFGLGLGIASQPQGERTIERWSTATPVGAVEETIMRSGSWNNSTFNFATRTAGGIFLMFHF